MPSLKEQMEFFEKLYGLGSAAPDVYGESPLRAIYKGLGHPKEQLEPTEQMKMWYIIKQLEEIIENQRQAVRYIQRVAADEALTAEDRIELIFTEANKCFCDSFNALNVDLPKPPIEEGK